MATDLNNVVLIGRLTRDPELKQNTQQTKVCKFSVANNRSYVVNGAKKEEVSYLNCVAWGALGETVNKYTKKGDKVAIEGRLKQNTWEDKDGSKRSSVDIVINSIQFLSKSGDQKNDVNNESIDEDVPF